MRVQVASCTYIDFLGYMIYIFVSPACIRRTHQRYQGRFNPFRSCCFHRSLHSGLLQVYFFDFTKRKRSVFIKPIDIKLPTFERLPRSSFYTSYGLFVQSTSRVGIDKKDGVRWRYSSHRGIKVREREAVNSKLCEDF